MLLVVWFSKLGEDDGSGDWDRSPALGLLADRLLNLAVQG